jgi:hypothetical protein
MVTHDSFCNETDCSAGLCHCGSLDKVLKTLNSLATGYEYASIKESNSRHWELSSVYAIRAQGIREAIKALEE